jgi:hypothetical protein
MIARSAAGPALDRNHAVGTQSRFAVRDLGIVDTLPSWMATFDFMQAILSSRSRVINDPK